MFRKLYEGLVRSLATLLENTPREEVVTRTDVSGAVDNSQINTWQTVFHLVKTPSLSRSFPALIKSSPLIGHHEHNSQRRNFWSWTVYFFCSWAVAGGLTDGDSGTNSGWHHAPLMFAGLSRTRVERFCSV